MPEYEIEWRKPVDGEDDRVIRTRWRGSTPEKVVENIMKLGFAISPAEVEGWPPPTVREIDEDGEYVT